jgi:dynein heavy chain
VLLRALRDFNLGKLTADDTSIFMGLLNDLFPRTAELVPRSVDREFEAKARRPRPARRLPAGRPHAGADAVAPPQVKEAAVELGYQPDDKFCLKVSQLREILVVRWSVFLLGPAGCGKSAIWRTLMRAQQLFGEKTVYKPINPKARAPSARTRARPPAMCKLACGPDPQAARSRSRATSCTAA